MLRISVDSYVQLIYIIFDENINCNIRTLIKKGVTKVQWFALLHRVESNDSISSLTRIDLKNRLESIGHSSLHDLR